MIVLNCENDVSLAGNPCGALPFTQKAMVSLLMPIAPKKPCRYPGCPRLTESTYCEEHAALARREYDRYERAPDVHRKYGRAWKRIRDRYAREHPYCERCFKEGRMTPMEEVHHILPVSRGGTHDSQNLMSLCRSCHNKIHIEMGDRHTHG